MIQEITDEVRLLPLPGVFQPISDSWILADLLRRERIEAGTSVLDLCTGSGVLALTAATLGADAVAIDISRRSVMTVRLNARLNGTRVTAHRGDLFAPVRGRRFDLIVSNPPYVPSVEDELPARGPARAWEGGPRGRAFLDRIFAEVPSYLTPGGALLFVQSNFCGEQETIDALRGRGLEPRVVLRHRGNFGPRVRERAAELRRRGVLDSDVDEMLFIRAELPVAAPRGAELVAS